MTKFDVSQFELKETASLTILNPKGDELQVDGGVVVFHLHGAGSKEYVNAKYKLENAGTAQMTALLRKGQVKDNAEVSAKHKAEFLAACTESIDNFPISALEVYSNPKLKYITEQVDKFLGDDENFM